MKDKIKLCILLVVVIIYPSILFGQSTPIGILKSNSYKAINLKTFDTIWLCNEFFSLYHEILNDKNLFYTAFPNTSNDDSDRRGKLVCVNLKDGSKQWEIRVSGLRWGSFIPSNEIIADRQNVYTWIRDTKDNKFYILAFDSNNGNEIWRVHVPIKTYERAVGKMAIRSGIFYFISNVNGHSFLNTIDLSDHQIIWTKEISNLTNDIQFSNDRIVLITNPSYFDTKYAGDKWYTRAILLDFNGNEIEIIKNTNIDFNKSHTDAEAGLVVNDKIYFRGALYVSVYDIKAKKELWRYTDTSGSVFDASPTDVVKGRFLISIPTQTLIVHRMDDTILLFDTITGKIKHEISDSELDQLPFISVSEQNLFCNVGVFSLSNFEKINMFRQKIIGFSNLK